MPKRSPASDRKAWLDQGLEMLAASGDSGLTVDALCRRMKKTKGSFYHHFETRDGFVRGLLERWEERIAADVSHDIPTPEDLRLERAIRFWAEHDLNARNVLRRVDRSREAALYRHFEASRLPPRRARLAARAHLALLVGLELLYRDLPRRELRELHAFVEDLALTRRA